MSRKRLDRTNLGKICSKCKELKPWPQFPKSKSRLDGYFDQCKPCHSKRVNQGKPRISRRLGFVDIERTARILEEIEESERLT